MEIIVLDIECGSIDPTVKFEVDNDIICDIGLVKLDLDTGNQEVLLGEICSEPQACHPDSWIFGNSSLTPKEVSESEPFSKYSKSIQEWFEKYPATSWNQKYDFPRLEHPSRGLNIPVRFWDPMRLMKHYMKYPHPNRPGYKWPTLPEGYQYFHGGKRPHRHRAVEDAQDAADVIYQIVQKWPKLYEEWESFSP